MSNIGNAGQPSEQQGSDIRLEPLNSDLAGPDQFVGYADDFEYPLPDNDIFPQHEQNQSDLGLLFENSSDLDALPQLTWNPNSDDIFMDPRLLQPSALHIPQHQITLASTPTIPRINMTLTDTSSGTEDFVHLTPPSRGYLSDQEATQMPNLDHNTTALSDLSEGMVSARELTPNSSSRSSGTPPDVNFDSVLSANVVAVTSPEPSQQKPAQPLLPKPNYARNIFQADLSRPRTQSSVNQPPLINSRALPSKGKRKTMDESQRQSTRKMRRVTPCIRCKMLNQRCNEGIPCYNCQKSQTKLEWPPCRYRADLGPVIAFRAGNARAGESRFPASKQGQFARDVKSTLSWSSNPVRRALLYYPFSQSRAASYAPLDIACREFVENGSQVLSEPWELSTGVIVPLKSAPYACDMTEANLEALRCYIRGCKDMLLEESIENLADELISLNLKEAVRFAQEEKRGAILGLEEGKPSAVSLALDILAASNFSCKRMVVSSEDEFCLRYTDAKSVIENGMFPIPAHFDVQIDRMTIQYMNEQMADIRERLKDIVYKKHNVHWYEIYLTMFLLIWNLEKIHLHQTGILRRFQAQNNDQYFAVRTTCNKMLHEWEISAKTLIYHWRGVLKGQVRFESRWTSEQRQTMRRDYGLDANAIATMDRLNDMTSTRVEELSEASRKQPDYDGGHPLGWISHLYFNGWY